MSNKPTNRVSIGSLYEMNKQLFKQINPPGVKQISLELANIGAWMSSNYGAKYFMLLCKERSDYTMIHINDFNFTQAVQEVKEVLEERGDIMGFDFVHGENAYQCWVRERGEDPQVYMFMLFDADWMVIEV